ncbi:MAG: glycoside hydrolase domain-containing protein [Pyrinomonadaceae bacterium]
MLKTYIRLSYTFLAIHQHFEYEFTGGLSMTHACFRFVFVLFILTVAASAQDSPFTRLSFGGLQHPPAAQELTESAEIKGIAGVTGPSGFVYTDGEVLRTDDRGETWRKINIPAGPRSGSLIADVFFVSESHGFALFTDKRGLELASTNDRGVSWNRLPIKLDDLDYLDAEPETAKLSMDGGVLTVTLNTAASSNFIGRVKYRSADEGATWNFDGRSLEKASENDAPETIASGTWNIKSNGRCEGFKTGCYQESTLDIAGEDKTPPRIKELAASVRSSAKQKAEETPMFALPPGGSTRISLNRGFDKCQAGSVAQMQTWWDNSPHFDSNIYFSGRNRACASQPVNSAWIDQVSAMGWGFIPTVVGYQSPCTASTTTAKLSYDPAVAETQGRGEADIAVTDAANIGLTSGSILYYDMERYDPPSPDTLGCRTATVAFLKGWTDRVKELGYKSGVYGSPKNAQEDWAGMPPASRMDAIWMARWDNVMSVWTYVTFPAFPTDAWNDHQRIKQWQAPHNETWAGVTFNIDGNISDSHVAGTPVRKNRNADFDGDGRSDVSVFRPESALWYVLNSSTSTFSVVTFGANTDLIAPGDYDGDGKTDYAVYRPNGGVWYSLGKGGVVAIRQFGSDGDIPVPGDYNCDGKTDIALFRPSNGVWYIANSDSLGTYTIVQFGQNGDKPVQADFDGDGKTDIAIWRPSTGDWYVLKSTTGSFIGYKFGISIDKPAQGDYDGDGKADYAVFRDGIWYILQSTNGFTAFHFGATGDMPVSADYDGDGRADPSVYRPSTGAWYLYQSQAGISGINFGAGADRPVPGGYLPR